jgi:hypothetical protein
LSSLVTLEHGLDLAPLVGFYDVALDLFWIRLGVGVAVVLFCMSELYVTDEIHIIP